MFATLSRNKNELDVAAASFAFGLVLAILVFVAAASFAFGLVLAILVFVAAASFAFGGFVIFARLNIRHVSIKSIAAIFLAGHIDAGRNSDQHRLLVHVCQSWLRRYGTEGGETQPLRRSE